MSGPSRGTRGPVASPARDWLERDLDVYCYLKAHLPPRYHVRCEPSSEYFSEWRYCYRVLRGDTMLREWRGDFRELEEGALVREARDLLRELRAETA